MLVKFVPFAVLNNGTDCNERQFWNMEAKFVPFAVLNNGTDCNEGQYWNMDVKFVFATPTIVTRSTFDW